MFSGSSAPTSRMRADPSRKVVRRVAWTAPSRRRVLVDEGHAANGARLAAIPVLVLALVTALGVTVYALASRTRAEAPAARADGFRPPERVSSTPDPVRDHLTDSGRAASTTSGLRPTSVDSAPRAIDTADSVGASAPSAVAPVRRRARRDSAPEVVPGWLSQGAKTWTPADTARRARPDSATAPRVRPDTVPPA